MCNKASSLLLHKFNIGINKSEFQIDVDLRLVRAYSKLAELEAVTREQIILDDGTIYLLPLDENNSLLIDDFKLDIKLNSIYELTNFNHQIELVLKLNINSTHISNLIYLAKQSVTFERQLFDEHMYKYSIIHRNITFLSELYEQLTLKEVERLEMSFYNKKSQSTGRIVWDKEFAQDPIKILIEHYRKQALNLYLPLINDVLSTKINLDEAKFSDLKLMIQKLNDYLKANSKSAGKRYLREILLQYIREKIPNIKTGTKNYPNTDEARVIFIILCLIGDRSIFPPNKQLTKAEKVKHVNQNDRIIKSVVEPFKDPPFSIDSIAPQDSRIFELYLPSFSK